MQALNLWWVIFSRVHCCRETKPSSFINYFFLLSSMKWINEAIFLCNGGWKLFLFHKRKKRIIVLIVALRKKKIDWFKQSIWKQNPSIACFCGCKVCWICVFMYQIKFSNRFWNIVIIIFSKCEVLQICAANQLSILLTVEQTGGFWGHRPADRRSQV